MGQLRQYIRTLPFPAMISLLVIVGDNYFNALRRMDFRMLKFKMKEEEFHEFLCTHFVAATREVRPDIVRLLFQQVKMFAYFTKALAFCTRQDFKKSVAS